MSADEKKEKKRLANVEKLEIKKAKQKAIIDAKRAKKRGITLKPSAEEGEGGEGGGEGGGEAVVEGGDDKTKLLEGDGTPAKEGTPNKKGKLSLRTLALALAPAPALALTRPTSPGRRGRAAGGEQHPDQSSDQHGLGRGGRASRPRRARCLRPP